MIQEDKSVTLKEQMQLELMNYKFKSLKND